MPPPPQGDGKKEDVNDTDDVVVIASTTSTPNTNTLLTMNDHDDTYLDASSTSIPFELNESNHVASVSTNDDSGHQNSISIRPQEVPIIPIVVYGIRHGRSISNTTTVTYITKPSLVANVIMGKVVLNPVVTVYVTAANMVSLKSMIISSDDDVLQKKFQQGYDNAKQYCIRYSILNVHHHCTSTL
jgi:hypothetical protein